MIKLASKRVLFNGFKYSPLANPPGHRFKHYRHYNDERALNTTERDSIFSVSLRRQKLWKNGFRVIKTINQGLFAPALTTLQQILPCSSNWGVWNPLRPRLKLHVSEKKTLLMGEKIPWNSILLHSTCSFSTHPPARQSSYHDVNVHIWTAEIEFIDFRLRVPAPATSELWFHHYNYQYNHAL